MDKTPVRLDELIDYVVRARPAGSSLDHLERAYATAGELDEIADHLIDHFVDRARDAGASWTQIGARLRVSKQAARKRFLPADIPTTKPMDKEKIFSRYTAPARQAIVIAQDAARAHHNHEVGTEHILLAILGQPGSLAVRAIEATATVEAITAATIARLPAPSTEVPDKIPFIGDARKVLKLALRKAFQLGHNEVGPEHLLLVLHSAPDGTAAQVLAAHQLTPDRVETDVRRLSERDHAQPTTA